MGISAKKTATELKDVRRYLERTNVVKGDANIIKAKHIVNDLIKRLEK